MQSKAPTIAAYLRELPPAERGVVKALDGLVRSSAPKFKASMKYGMPTYELEGRMLALNAQRNYYSFYADPAIVRRFRGELRGWSVGKSCIRFRKLDDLPLELIGRAIKRVPAKTYIQYCEASLAAAKGAGPRRKKSGG